MKRFTLAIALGVAALAAQAADKAPSAQNNKMTTCNKEAEGKKGDERKAFMKECLSTKAGDAPVGANPSAPSTACEKSAADKKLHGAAAKAHIKKCTADAASAPKS